MKILAVIPARGGSKGIKNKNLVNFNGKPLIYWTIQAAKKSKLISEIVVSTDSKAIQKFSEKVGVKVDQLRPKSLSQDDSLTIDVIQFELEKLNKKKIFPNYIVTLQPTSPLRNENHIDKAIKMICRDKNADSLVSCVKIPHNYSPESLMVKSKNYLINSKFHKNIFRRQDKKTYFARNGAAIYITKTSKIRNYIFGGKILAFEMDFFTSIDIDTLTDLKLAETIKKYEFNK